MKHEVVYIGMYGDQRGTSEVSAENGWTITGNTAWNQKLQLGFSWEESAFDGMEEFRIPTKSIKETGSYRIKSIIPNQGKIIGYENDGSSLVVPFEHGILSHCQGKTETQFDFPIYAAWPSMCTMTLYGIINGKQSTAAIIEDGKWDAEFRFRMNWGPEHVYSMDVVFNIREFADEEVQRDDCVIRYKKITGGWPAMGRFYREYVRKNRGIKTLKEKMNPVLEYAMKALILRFRIAVRRLPHNLPHMTPDLQPPVIVYLTFDMVRKIAEEFHRQGVGPSEFSLVGWNYGGHDGAWPKIFPVEERAGGEESLVRNIKEIDKLGYPVSLHECFTGVFELAAETNEYDVNDLVYNHDGKVALGGVLGGGQVLRNCPQQAMKYAKRNFARTSKLPIRGCYYCDVMSIMELRKCFNHRHPLDRRGFAESWKKILQLMHDTFGGSFSEGAREWSLPELDKTFIIGLYMDPKRPYYEQEKLYDYDWFDEEVPLYEIVYHGSLIYNCYREGINAKPGEHLYLRNFAYGGNPMFYYHHLFNPEWDNKGFGWDNDWLKYNTPENLVRDIAVIKHGSDDMARQAPMQGEFMDDFIKHSDTLTQTVYSNGKSVWVNYGDTEVKTSEGKTIPAKDFIVV